jgi:Spy/CpxP family protein refolding chaperone
MKKLLLTALLTLSPLFAQEEIKINPYLHGDEFPKGYFLTVDAMPHFMHLYMKQGGSFKIEDLTEKQEDTIEAMFAKTPPKVMKLAKEIKALETEVVLAVIEEGQNAKMLDEKLTAIAEKRKAMTVLKIECLNMFKETLTPKQFDVLKKMAQEEAQK